MKLTVEDFHWIFIDASEEVADKYYPKNECAYATSAHPCTYGSTEICKHPKSERSNRRGEYLRDQGVLYAKLVQKLHRDGRVFEEDEPDDTPFEV